MWSRVQGQAPEYFQKFVQNWFFVFAPIKTKMNLCGVFWQKFRSRKIFLQIVKNFEMSAWPLSYHAIRPFSRAVVAQLVRVPACHAGVAGSSPVNRAILPTLLNAWLQSQKFFGYSAHPSLGFYWLPKDFHAHPDFRTPSPFLNRHTARFCAVGDIGDEYPILCDD